MCVIIIDCKQLNAICSDFGLLHKAQIISKLDPPMGGGVKLISIVLGGQKHEKLIANYRYLLQFESVAKFGHTIGLFSAPEFV